MWLGSIQSSRVGHRSSRDKAHPLRRRPGCTPPFSLAVQASVEERGPLEAPVDALTVDPVVATSAQVKTLPFALEIAACNIPNPSKAHYGGEDAWFVIPYSGSKGNFGGSFGVFDGVGGWGEENVNPGDYSLKFAEASRAYMQVRHLN